MGKVISRALILSALWVVVYISNSWGQSAGSDPGAGSAFVTVVVVFIVVYAIYKNLSVKKKKKAAQIQKEEAEEWEKQRIAQVKADQEKRFLEEQASRERSRKLAEEQAQREEKQKKQKEKEHKEREKKKTELTVLKERREAKIERELAVPLRTQLAMKKVELSPNRSTIAFDKYKSFFMTNPSEEDRNILEVTWHRNVSKISEREKLALLILEFAKAEQNISYDDYQFLSGSIIYNTMDDVRTEYHNLESYNESLVNHNMHPTGITSEDAVSKSFIIYEEIVENGLSQNIGLLSKYFYKGASWFSQGDFSSSRTIRNYEAPYSLFLGALEDSYVFYDSDESLITIAPPGAGKTQCNVLSNLIMYKAPAIILDVKGDCYNETAKFRECHGKVYSFNPLDIENSSHYNPIDFMSSKPLEIWQDAQKLTKLIIVPNQKSDHWDKRAGDILTAIIAYVKLEDDTKTMTKVCDWASASPDEYDILIASLTLSDVNGMRRAGNSLQSMLQNNPKQFEGVLDTLRGFLGAWEGDNVSAITNKSDWHIKDFMTAKEGSPSLYLIIPPAEIETYAPVLRVLIGQHMSYFLSDHENVAERPILFMLDEMPRLGKFDLIPQVQDTGRSYNIKIWMFAQYVGQLRNAYGKDIADGMIGAAGVRIYMNPSEDNAAELSRQLGDCDDVLLGKKIPLASAIELKGKEFRDDIIVMPKGESPLRLKKIFFSDIDFNIVEPEEPVSVEVETIPEAAEIPLADA